MLQLGSNIPQSALLPQNMPNAALSALHLYSTTVAALLSCTLKVGRSLDTNLAFMPCPVKCTSIIYQQQYIIIMP